MTILWIKDLNDGIQGAGAAGTSGSHPGDVCVSVTAGHFHPRRPVEQKEQHGFGLSSAQPTLGPKSHSRPRAATAHDAGTHQQLLPGDQRPPEQ